MSVVNTTQAGTVNISTFYQGSRPQYENIFLQFAAPNLGGGIPTITQALLYCYCTVTGTGLQTGSVFCDQVGAWDVNSGASTLLALAFNAATAASQDFASATGWRTFDVLGASGVNGIANIYAASGNPGGVISCKMFVDLSLAQTAEDNAQSLMQIGDDYNDIGSVFAGASEANYPYIHITYTRGATIVPLVDHHYKMLRNQ